MTDREFADWLRDLEKRITDRLDSAKDDVNEQFERIDKRFERIEKRFFVGNGEEAVITRVKILENEVVVLKDNSTSHSGRAWKLVLMVIAAALAIAGRVYF